MTHSYKLARRMARHRAPLLTALMLIAACNSTDSLDQGSIVDTPTNDQPATSELVPTTTVDAATTGTGGMPFGTFDQPIEVFGSQFNGGLRIITPSYLMKRLAEIKSRGGKVILDLAGSQRMWKDASGHFSMTKWKERVNRYKGLNFNSYINDGTIIGHYIIDEPNDPTNWNGRIVSAATVEEMAKYSKQLWPNLATIVRSQPDFMATYSGTFRYLDAAWAQYVTRKGTASDYLKKNLSYAQKKGLALVVGLNITHGGNGGTRMTPSQVKSFGTTMLSSSYPCAFISWTYSSSYLSGSYKDALSSLRAITRNRSAKSCRS
ncbi:MAG TPA: hypothetical protein VH763_13695 [Gemmatimonadales bacterium]